ncbi:hypothetical protein LWI28_008926 [Acer negundo]|uniref:Ubiquitin receptor RAD23 n=1 Tax=Acer negundo TaxID=4023 RepID=A0AAD5IQK7_ACENE|nr:hypothetical protein LWI28_008926 [Acer negundo]
MVNEDWVEGDVGLMLMVHPDFITINDDPKLELVEEECHAATKVGKEASLGIGDQSAPKFSNIWVLDSGNTAEEHGLAMVIRLDFIVCAEGNVGSQLAAAMPQSVTVTPEVREAIERLEAMGFDRAIVFDKNTF